MKIIFPVSVRMSAARFFCFSVSSNRKYPISFAAICQFLSPKQSPLDSKGSSLSARSVFTYHCPARGSGKRAVRVAATRFLRARLGIAQSGFFIRACCTEKQITKARHRPPSPINPSDLVTAEQMDQGLGGQVQAIGAALRERLATSAMPTWFRSSICSRRSCRVSFFPDTD